MLFFFPLSVHLVPKLMVFRSWLKQFCFSDFNIIGDLYDLLSLIFLLVIFDCIYEVFYPILMLFVIDVLVYGALSWKYKVER